MTQNQPFYPILGENGEWTKHNNFDLANHAPMMIHIPGLTDQEIPVDQLTEFVDLFPTLVEAAELPALDLCPINSSSVSLCREGESLMPLVYNSSSPWKQRVFFQYPRSGTIMGYSMRTPRYRYTEWVRFKGRPYYRPDWTKLRAVELYDHDKDPEENHNCANDPGLKSVRYHLSAMLHRGWRGALVKRGKMSPSYVYKGISFTVHQNENVTPTVRYIVHRGNDALMHDLFYQTVLVSVFLFFVYRFF